MDDEMLTKFLEWRGIEEMCGACTGAGKRMYGSTSTWRGGVGGCMMTVGVCDKCWGSGCLKVKGADLRVISCQRVEMDAEACAQWLARLLNVRSERFRKRVQCLANFCDAQVRKIKIPEGENRYDWNASWEALARQLRKLCANPQHSNSGEGPEA